MRFTRKVTVVLVAVVMLGLAAMSSALILLSGQMAVSGQKIPWLFGCSPPTIRYNLPINTTGATLYAKNLIKNYNNLVNSREGQSGNFASIQHFFPLYASIGNTFNVYVARDNQSQTDDMVELFFAPIPGTDPKVSVFTNQTGAELRGAITNCPNQAVRVDYAISTTPYWTILSDVSINSPLGINYFPLIWVTNASSVFNDPTGSVSAAKTIYGNEHGIYLQSLGTPFPSWAWFGNILKQLLDYFLVFAAVVGVYGVYLQIKDRGAAQRARIRHPRDSKKSDKTESGDEG